MIYLSIPAPSLRFLSEDFHAATGQDYVVGLLETGAKAPQARGLQCVKDCPCLLD